MDIDINPVLEVFLDELRQEKLTYDKNTGFFWRHWEPRRNWLPCSKRAEKKASNGYLLLRRASVGYIMAHRVAYTWCKGAIPEGYVIDHKNDIRDDNRIDNLSVMTQKCNFNKALKTKRWTPAYGNDAGKTKILEENIPKIFTMYADGYLQREIADIFNVRPNQISRIITGTRRNSESKINERK
jgi:hypothetical protein